MNPNCSSFSKAQLAEAEDKAREGVKKRFKNDPLFLVGKDFSKGPNK